jgi:hypothetical protein
MPTLNYLRVPTSNDSSVQSDSRNAASARHDNHRLVLMPTYANDLIYMQSTTLDA